MAAKNRVVVQYRLGIAKKTAEELILKHGGKVIAKIPKVGFYLAGSSEGSELKFMESISREPSVQSANPDFLLSRQGYTAAPVEGVAQYMEEIRAPEAWNYLKEKGPYRKIDIGIIDNGFYGLREGKGDFDGRLKEIPYGGDKESHGTQAVVIAAASGNNGPQSNVGINWTSEVFLGEVLFSSGLAWSFWRMVNEGVKVINISLGGGQPEAAGKGICQAADGVRQLHFLRELATMLTMTTFFKSQEEENFLVVVAAGNQNCELANDLGEVEKPGNLIIVGGSRNGTAAEGSNKGGLIDIAAPYDVQQLYSYIDETFSDYGGTSYAAPQVTGAAALVWAFNREIKTPRQVVERLKKTAQNSIPEFGGAGVLDVKAAVSGLREQGVNKRTIIEKKPIMRKEAPKRENVF